MTDWLRGHPKDGYELIVAHSHAHGDHVAADGQFTGRPHTRVVGHSAEEVAAFFGIGNWPQGTARVDLGGRVLEVIPTPGHHPSAVAVYDEATGMLLTGDTVYPGRLYVQDFPAFQDSLRTLCDFSASHPVSVVLGAHIEMSARPFRDFPLGSTWHPGEAPLPDDGRGPARDPGCGRPDRRPPRGAPVRQLHHLERALPAGSPRSRSVFGLLPVRALGR